METKYLVLGALTLLASGCAGLDFEADKGLVYFEPVPYVHYKVTPKCEATVSVVALPGERKHLAFKTGYGSSTLSAAVSGGILTSVGQATDTKVPETLTAIAGLKTAGLLADGGGDGVACPPVSLLIPFKAGKLDMDTAEPLPIG
ncbi:MAG: hypothetical protein AAGH76_08710 [Pseudomonadota bacterium]